MNKRGQIYILVALVLSIVIYSLVQVANYVGQENIESDFDRISSTFEEESAKTINSMIEAGRSEEEISSAFLDFSLRYATYARTVNPKFGMLFGYKNSTSVLLGNYLEETSTVSGHGDLPGCYSNICAGISFDAIGTEACESLAAIEDCMMVIKPVPAELDVTVQGIPYTIKFDSSKPYEVFAISWEEHEDQRKVFTSGIAKGDMH